jgi:hypothetical protein
MAGSLLPRAPVRSSGRAPAGQPTVQYVGFDDVPDRRNYHLIVQQGDAVRELTVWIPRDAFTRRAAAVQDGPDICFQKLVRELSGRGLEGPATIGVTDVDLVTYKQSREPQPAKRHSPRRVFTAEDQGVPAETPEESA